MAKRTRWKIAAAVLAVVIAGSVYCVFFPEEKDDTVHYRIDEVSVGDVGDMSVSSTRDYGAQAGSIVQHSGSSSNGGTVQNNGIRQNSEMTDTDVQSDSAKLVYVHVCGAVRNPAVYSLPEGSRVCDVIAKAGGLTEDAADDYVNQARFLSDGERVYIPEKKELSNLSASQYAEGQPVNGTGGLNGSGAQTGGQEEYPVNINIAGVSELTSLPGIGESRAESIITYREQYGAFSRIEDIMKVSGIKGAAYEKIKDRICTGNE